MRQGCQSPMSIYSHNTTISRLNSLFSWPWKDRTMTTQKLSLSISAAIENRCILNPCTLGSSRVGLMKARLRYSELSESATRLKRDKLTRVPYNHEGKHPGKRWAQLALDLMFELGNKAIFRRYDADPTPPADGGAIYVATYINGLIDPMVITRIQNKRVISLGRHGFDYSPSNRMVGETIWNATSSPSSRSRGRSCRCRFCEIHQRQGYVDCGLLSSNRTFCRCYVYGKSHQDSKLHALRTGSSRAALASAAIADEKGLPAPIIQTVGLHWRTHHWLRTDNYVEFGESIEIPSIYSAEDRTRLVSGEWVEPSYEETRKLRDRIFDVLSPMTPDAPDWDTFRSWKLLAHIGANKTKTPLMTLAEEVRATREVRESIGRRK